MKIAMILLVMSVLFNSVSYAACCGAGCGKPVDGEETQTEKE